ncbi:cation:proton antiporter [Nitrosarchaeum sp. AC2]|uniref:cation:proton antiporter domain-containing protein n=1 Tax=Nitrosarchaeum sp. AC2 TaxID=2259673 RepID=UPI0021058089|nr:cation:proton antiporter [Nitrosarchaeum sp. AC2]
MIVVITVLTIFGKIFGVYVGVKIFGSGKQYALAIGLSMASLGEFSFIVLKTGMDLGVVSDNLFPIVGMVVVLTTFLGVLMAKKGIKTVEAYE